MRKAFVLLSGGIDSTTCLHKAIVDYHPIDAGHGKMCIDLALDSSMPTYPGYAKDIIGKYVEAISINYGQRHFKETAYARHTCERLGIQHTILDIGRVLSGANTMLTDKSVQIPDISYGEIKGVSPTYVPFRNGTLLSVITAYAQKWVNAQIESLISIDADPQEQRRRATDELVDSVGIYFGAHAEDAANWAYPDCTPEFIGAMANAIYIGSYRTIRLHTPLQWLDKAEIIRLGERLRVRWSDTWSCYAGGELHCGTCPTCRARKAGFVVANVKDPTEYAA